MYKKEMSTDLHIKYHRELIDSNKIFDVNCLLLESLFVLIYTIFHNEGKHDRI